MRILSLLSALGTQEHVATSPANITESKLSADSVSLVAYAREVEHMAMMVVFCYTNPAAMSGSLIGVLRNPISVNGDGVSHQGRRFCISCGEEGAEHSDHACFGIRLLIGSFTIAPT